MKKLLIPVTILLALLISAAALAQQSFAPVDFNMEEKAAAAAVIEDNVTVDGVDVSGMSAQQAKRAVHLSDTAALGSEITFKLGEKEVTATWRSFNVSFDDEALFEELTSCDAGLISRYKLNADYDAVGRAFTVPVTYDKTAVTEFVLTELKALDCEAKDAGLTRENGQFVIVPSEQGIIVDTDATTAAIMELLDAGEIKETTIETASEISEPEITDDMLKDIKDVLGTCQTNVSGSSNRATNVKVGSANINGTILLPGEQASVNELLLPRTAENGYRMAPQYNNGRSQDVYGGGICQVSSTLYNALLAAEIQIDERSNHSMLISYLDASKDAAISAGVKDLKFTNNLDYPIYIEGASVDRVCTFTIYGKETRPANRTVEYKSVITSQYYPADKMVYLADQPVGYTVYEGDARHPETKSYLKKIVTVNGEVESETILYHDYYMGSSKTCYVGTMVTETQPAETQPAETQPAASAPSTE